MVKSETRSSSNQGWGHKLRPKASCEGIHRCFLVRESVNRMEKARWLEAKNEAKTADCEDRAKFKQPRAEKSDSYVRILYVWPPAERTTQQLNKDIDWLVVREGRPACDDGRNSC